MSCHSPHGHYLYSRCATSESLCCCYLGITVHFLQVLQNPSGMSVAVITNHDIVAYVIQIKAQPLVVQRCEIECLLCVPLWFYEHWCSTRVPAIWNETQPIGRLARRKRPVWQWYLLQILHHAVILWLWWKVFHPPWPICLHMPKRLSRWYLVNECTLSMWHWQLQPSLLHKCIQKTSKIVWQLV